MSRKITKEEFKEKIIKRYNIKEEDFTILEFKSMSEPCVIKCNICEKITTLKQAESFVRTDKKQFCQHDKKRMRAIAFEEEREKKFFQKLKQHYPKEDLTVIKYSKMDETAIVQCNVCKNTYTLMASSFFNVNKTKVCDFCFPLRKDTEEVKHKIEYLIKNNDKIELLNSYTKITDNLILKCNNCNGVFKRMPRIFLKSQKCPYCETHSKKRTKEVFQQELDNKYGEEYTLLGEYIDTNTSTLFKHNDCGFIFKATPHNVLQKAPCPKCKKFNSKGEIKVKKILEKHNISFEQQKRFDDFSSLLSFDFFCPEKKVLIEFQGEQHYHPIKHFGGEAKFKKQVENDNKKREYCKDKDLNLIEISYLDIDKIEEKLNFLWFND